MGLDVVLERLEALAGEARRALRPADDAAAARRPGPPRAEERAWASTPTRRPTRATSPRRSSSRRAATSAIAWLVQRPDATRSRPTSSRDLGAVWETREVDGHPRARRRLGLAGRSSARAPTSRRSPQMDEAAGKALVDAGPRPAARDRRPPTSPRSPRSTALAFGGGCELAMACDVRIAARSRRSSASPRSSSASSPASAAPSACRAWSASNKALEMNLIGDAITAEEAYEFGLVNRVVPTTSCSTTALSWARKLAGQAPIAVGQIKKVSAKGDLDEGIEAEKARLRAPRSSPRTPRRASAPSSASARRSGRASSDVERRAASRSSSAGPGRWSRSPARGSPCRRGSPTSARRAAACGPTSTRWRSPTSTPGAPTRSASGTSTATASRRCRTSEPNGAHEVLVELERRGCLDGVITQNIDRLHRRAGQRELVEVHGTIDTSSCLTCGAAYPLEEVRAAPGGLAGLRSRVRLR